MSFDVMDEKSRREDEVGTWKREKSPPLPRLPPGSGREKVRRKKKLGIARDKTEHAKNKLGQRAKGSQNGKLREGDCQRWL